MFCPECGSEERAANQQFCRACGVDLRRVRTAVSSPDAIAPGTARDEIGHAIAAKISQIRGAEELSVLAEDVLPGLEKFFESPEERRMRRMRTGTILSSVGLGVAIGMMVVAIAMNDQELIFLAALGVVAFFIGLGFILNGLLLTVPKKPEATAASDGRELRNPDAELRLPSRDPSFVSVTESTTRNLSADDSLVNR